MKKRKMVNDFLEWEITLKSIGNDINLFDDIHQIPYYEHPTKLFDYTVAGIILKGKLEMGINLERYVFEAPCIMYCLEGQIVQYFYASDDCSGLFIALSKHFTDTLQTNLLQLTPLFFYLKENPATSLSENELSLISDCFSLLSKTVSNTSDLYRMEIAKHLSEAFFFILYSIVQPYMKTDSDDRKTRQESILKQFLECVHKHYKKQRNLGFYADKLCLTPKHLSAVVKNTSGQSANNWIDQYVILEAKALLKSIDVSIQQISDELNFTSPAFFSKYFKQHVGISPKEYRNK